MIYQTEKVLMKYLFIILFLLFSSCKFPNFKKNRGGGSGGGGGSIPTSDQLRDFLGMSTDNPTDICSSERTGNDNSSPSNRPKFMPIGSHGGWTDEYTDVVYKNLESKDFEPLLKAKIKKDDLDDIGCPQYNYLSDEDKKKFWTIFFAGLSVPESSTNPHNKTNECDKSGNCWTSVGLLQISEKTASKHCGKRMGYPLVEGYGEKLHLIPEDNLHNPDTNITCSMHIIMNQLLGSPRIKNGSISMGRPEWKGRLLQPVGADPYYWGPLKRSSNGFPKLQKFTKTYLSVQLKACNSNPLVPDDNYEKPKCDNTVSNENRRVGKVCVRAPCPEEYTSEDTTDTGSDSVSK